MIHCPICTHGLRKEIEAQYLAGASAEALTKTYGPRVSGLNVLLLRRHLNNHLSAPESIVLSPPGLPSIELEPVDIEEAYDSLTRGCYRLLQAEMAYQMSNPSAADPKRFTVLLDAFNKLTGGRDIDNAVSLITRAGFEVIDPTGMLSAEVVDAAKD